MRISDWSSDVCSSDLEPPRWRLWLRRTLRWGLGLAVVALVALGVAVGIAVQRMPSFEELKKSPAGQTIRVRAADGTVFLSLGPNYGRWLTLRATPQVMQDAMAAVADRRDRQSVVEGKSVSVRVDVGGGRIIKKKK